MVKHLIFLYFQFLFGSDRLEHDCGSFLPFRYNNFYSALGEQCCSFVGMNGKFKNLTVLCVFSKENSPEFRRKHMCSTPCHFLGWDWNDWRWLRSCSCGVEIKPLIKLIDVNNLNQSFQGSLKKCANASDHKYINLHRKFTQCNTSWWKILI